MTELILDNIYADYFDSSSSMIKSSHNRSYLEEFIYRGLCNRTPIKYRHTVTSKSNKKYCILYKNKY